MMVPEDMEYIFPWHKRLASKLFDKTHLHEDDYLGFCGTHKRYFVDRPHTKDDIRCPLCDNEWLKEHGYDIKTGQPIPQIKYKVYCKKCNKESEVYVSGFKNNDDELGEHLHCAFCGEIVATFL